VQRRLEREETKNSHNLNKNVILYQESNLSGHVTFTLFPLPQIAKGHWEEINQHHHWQRLN
jgi:hypothetical protein